MSELVVHPVTPDRWSDLVDLFERPGPRGGTPMPGSCWCMWWRQRSGDAAVNKEAMHVLVADGAEPGLLAYADGVPVGWVSVAPRAGFGQLLRSPRYRPRDTDEGVYAVVCFYVDPRHKRTGVASALLDAAIVQARAHGATAVEAYPNASPDYMGSLGAFEARGFRVTRTAGTRAVVRLGIEEDGGAGGAPDGSGHRRAGRPS